MNDKKIARSSNIELLRIVAMFLILFGHSQLRLSPIPGSEAIIDAPISSFFKVMQSCVATVGVVIFVAISGWFGIKFKRQGIIKIVFTILFTLFLIYGVAIVTNIVNFSFEGLKVCLTFYEGYWFVIGYIGLYIISPVLNSFIDNASQHEYKIVLTSFYVFQCIYSWLSAWYNYYNGYSILLFAGIYLTAAYVRKYPIAFLEKHAAKLLVAVVLTMTTISYISLFCFDNAARQARDDNPLIIFTAILLILLFKRININSALINWLASSCFAVYLIGYNPIVYKYFMSVVRYLYAQHSGITYSFLIIAFLIITYIICAIIDQIRIFIWDLVNNHKKNLFIKK